MPVLAVVLVPQKALILSVSVLSIACLALLGAWGARMGGAPLLPGVVRVTFWGAIAMALTAGVGMMFGAQT